MEPIRDPEIIDRMRTTFELYEAAEQIMEQNLRRRHPELSAEEIEQRMVEWLSHRPGAELGDAVGRPMDQFQDLL